MKKEIILSFRPAYFKVILFGIKKYEYRSRFNKGPLRAYLYLSRPVQQIVGILELGTPLKLIEVLDGYDQGTLQYDRINYMYDNGNNLAIPIEAFYMFEESLSLEEMKKVQNNFRPPMSYAFANNYDVLYDTLKSRKRHKGTFFHCHEIIHVDNIGMTCEEMASLEFFSRQEKNHRADVRYERLFRLLDQ